MLPMNAYVIVYLIIGAALLGFSALLFWNERRLDRRSAESVNWPQVDGQITKNEIREGASPDVKYFRGEYTFAVQGVTHKGSITSLGPDRLDFTAMQNKYPNGLTVSVYYKPSKPSVNTIEPGARTKPNDALLYYLGGLALGGWSVWASLTGIPIADRHRSPVRRFIAGVAVLPATYFTVPASHRGCLLLAQAAPIPAFVSVTGRISAARLYGRRGSS